MPPPTQCFLSYAHKDHAAFDRLQVNLRPIAHLYGFKLWHDRRIHAGRTWDREIQTQLEKSQIFVLLSTNDFFASEYIINHEIPAIIQQHRTKSALVLPVIYRECCWKTFFGDYIQAVPMDQRGKLRPVRDWPDREKALALAANAISASIKDWFGIEPNSPFTPPADP